jgi:hypothetical protein
MSDRYPHPLIVRLVYYAVFLIIVLAIVEYALGALGVEHSPILIRIANGLARFVQWI